jgi:mono/diheme cytochrome c family protein
MRRFTFGFILGLLVLPVGGFVYFKLGKPPVATADPPLPFEAQIVALPLHARIDREMPKTVPIAANEGTFAAGAAIYQAQCSACHGLPDHASTFAEGMFPKAPQLFVRHGDHVGVSDDEPGESYWKVANGIRLSGMPAYNHVLSDTEMWQVTLLVANADKLPARVLQALKPGTGAK